MSDALLGADEGEDFRSGVQLHAEATAVPVGHGAAELGQAFGLRVAVVGPLLRRLSQPVKDALGSGDVRVADAECDHGLPFGTLVRDPA